MIPWFIALALQGAPITEAIPPAGDEPACTIKYDTVPSSVPRLDPIFRIEHPYEVVGLLEEDQKMVERIFVYVSAKDYLPVAVLAARQIMRMLAYAKASFGFDLPLAYGRQLHLFLTEAGKPGGEQGIFEGPAPDGRLKSYNCVYVYDIQSFTNPTERARELAHEFGHAVLPAVGGFSQPERWANGVLGELTFLRFLGSNPSLEERDRMGAKADEIMDLWNRKIQPAIRQAFYRGVRIHPGDGKTEMDEYIGMMGLVLEAFPQAFSRAMLLAGGNTAYDAEQGVLRAIGERNEWSVRLPAWLGNSAVYLPAPGDWRVEGAKILARKGDWIKLQPTQNLLVLRRASG